MKTMRVHTLTVLQLNDDGTYTPLIDVSYEYSGVVAECKKGRETVEQNMKADQATAAQNRANSQAQYGNANALEQEEMGSTTPGSLSPAASAQLAADRDNISRTYNGIRQTAFRTLGQRGFGSAPSGFALAAENGNDQGEAGANTGAYRNAQINTQNQRQDAEHTAAGMSGTQGSLGNTASGESTTAAFDRSKMGSTLGDIGQGIGEAAGIAGDVMGMGGMMKGIMPGMPGGGSLPTQLPLNNPFANNGGVSPFSRIGNGVGNY